MHDGVVEPFEGGYAAYILQRVERDRQAAASEQRRQNLARKELAWLRRGAPARTSKPKFRIDAANALIDDVPPIRDTVALSQMATARLGKDVVDLLDVGVTFGDDVILRDVEWRIAPGERTGVLGPNGAGKSTLLNLVSGKLQPTSGRVKTGKTVQVAVLDQQLADLQQFADDRVREASPQEDLVRGGRQGDDPVAAARATRLHLGAALHAVKDLSGGQMRRLQLMLILLDEPNVLILDEPTNDLDTDMLAAMEDLLDTWPGTLLVVSHDRYLLERVTDQQYAVLGGHLRHLPAASTSTCGCVHRAPSRRPRLRLPPRRPGGPTRLGGRLRFRWGRLQCPCRTRSVGCGPPGRGEGDGGARPPDRQGRCRPAEAARRLRDARPVRLRRARGAADAARGARAEVEQLEERWLEVAEALGV